MALIDESTGEAAASGALAGAAAGPEGALIGAGVSVLGNVLPRIFGANKRKQALADAANSFKTPQGTLDAVSEARGLAAMGDPNYNVNQRQIERQQANAVAEAKTTGNVSDILNSVQRSQQTATDASLRNTASDTAYRQNAGRYLAQALQSLGGVQMGVQRANYGAVQTEFNRQQQQLQGYAQAANNLGKDITSYGMMKQYGVGGFGSPMGGYGYPSYGNAARYSSTYGRVPNQWSPGLDNYSIPDGE